MFRKLTDRFNGAVSAMVGSPSSSPSNEEKVQQLTSMGFDRTQAEQALQATSGDVDQATELLLASTQQPEPPQPPAVSQQEQEDQDLQRAMEASLSDHPSHAPNRQTRTAAMEKAAQAAQARHNNNNGNPKKKKASSPMTTTAVTATQKHVVNNNKNNNLRLSTASAALAANHPGVKVVPKLQDKSVEEQLLRCADRLKSSPQAVDTLYKALRTLQQHPDEERFRTIDTTNVGFQRSVASAPGAMDFLKALNFQMYGNKLVLHQVDPARVYLGVSALEQTKESPEYIAAKQTLQLTQELQDMQRLADDNEQEALQRAQFLAKCPSEPTEGRGAWMQVAFGGGGGSDSTTLKRRFDADDTLQDVLHWLAASLGQGLLDKLVTSREWMLRDLNRGAQDLPLDCAQHAPLTLQYLGCWPSGRLEIAVSSDAWKQQGSNNNNGAAKTTVADVRGSARGLGAAPKEAL